MHGSSHAGKSQGGKGHEAKRPRDKGRHKDYQSLQRSFKTERVGGEKPSSRQTTKNNPRQSEHHAKQAKAAQSVLPAVITAKVQKEAEQSHHNTVVEGIRTKDAMFELLFLK